MAISRTAMRLTAIVAAGMTALSLGATNAFASADSYNDDFHIYTTDQCGKVSFFDYGPYDGGTDDYVEILDTCSDGHGVRGWFTKNGVTSPVQGIYNGLKVGTPVDYFPWDGDRTVVGGDDLILRVCLVDGVGDQSGDKCAIASHTSVDG